MIGTVETNPIWLMENPKFIEYSQKIERHILRDEVVMSDELPPKYPLLPPSEVNPQEYYTSKRYLTNQLAQIAPRNRSECSAMDVIDVYNDTLIGVELKKIIGVLWTQYQHYSIQITGNFVYPEGGFMGWHTNYMQPGIRMYMTYAAEADKSGFLYYDGEHIITSYDKCGWTIRFFDTSSSANPLWHAVIADVERYSFGFTLSPL